MTDYSDVHVFVIVHICLFVCLFIANYHGSTGFGQDFLEALPGNVGTLDVQDVQVTIATAQ